MYFDLPFDTETSVGGESCVIATYQVGGISETDALKKAGGFATGQTVGTWLPLPGVTRRMQEGYQARVLSMHLLP
ncbi:MAG: transcriptional regulator, partial [Clostridiales bacterium]|nr:transcriptional regulator [Clostridiales bacterium]